MEFQLNLHFLLLLSCSVLWVDLEEGDLRRFLDVVVKVELSSVLNFKESGSFFIYVDVPKINYVRPNGEIYYP